MGCPQLCSDQSAALFDTTLTGAIVQDTVLTGFPLFGSSRDFTMIAQGDTADVRIVQRYDSLPTTYHDPRTLADSTLTRVDSAMIVFVVDTTIGRPTTPVTITAFDVDTTVADTLPKLLVPLFRPDRRIGQFTYQPNDIRDTLRLPLDSGVILSRATAGKRLRVGLQISSTKSVRLRIAGSVYAPRITFRASPDTAIPPDTIILSSRTPTDDPIVASVYGMYPIIVSGAVPPPPQNVLAVGGLAGARTYVRFDIPPLLLDSVQVIRASLLLRQIPSRLPGNASDTMAILINPVVASSQLTDVFTISQFLGSGISNGIDSVRLVPKDSGQKSIELVNLFRVWRAAGTSNTIRAVVIRAAHELSSPAELDFVATEAPVDLRPRLRLTVVPRRGFGLP